MADADADWIAGPPTSTGRYWIVIDGKVTEATLEGGQLIAWTSAHCANIFDAGQIPVSPVTHHKEWAPPEPPRGDAATDDPPPSAP